MIPDSGPLGVDQAKQRGTDAVLTLSHVLPISCLFLSQFGPFVLARRQVSALLYVHELSGVSKVNRRTIPSGDRDLGVAGIRAQLACKIAAHVRTPGQHATAIPGLTLYRLLGGLPLALGTGTGARRPLGITIVGGLLFSQLFDALYDSGGVPPG
jgi:hypothetical protein